MYNNDPNYHPNVADILYGSYIRYERLFEMTKYAFYGKTDSNDVNIFIDVYSILNSLYKRGTNIQIVDSYAIASCIINLAIHLRAYFESRHHVSSKVYIIYGGARPTNASQVYPAYNMRNIQMEDSNEYLKGLIKDNLEVVTILCRYLYDIFAIVDYENEFSVMSSALIDLNKEQGNTAPNIIYSKDPLSYQLVAFKPYTFLYRPKKRANSDDSWVVTKSTLYNAYRYGELGLTKQFETSLNVNMFSIYQAVSGVKSRNLLSSKNGNATIKLLEKAVEDNVFSMGYNAGSILGGGYRPFEVLCEGTNLSHLDILARFTAIDLNYQTMLYTMGTSYIANLVELINLYNPQEVRNINDKYFQTYPLDLNRV